MESNDIRPPGDPGEYALIRVAVERFAGGFCTVRCQGSEDGVNWETFHQYQISAKRPSRRSVDRRETN